MIGVVWCANKYNVFLDAVFHFEQAALSVDEGQGFVDVYVVNTGNTSFFANLRWDYY